MNFCITCGNMYYIRINADDPNKLVYYCRSCGGENNTIMEGSTCVSRTVVQKSAAQSFGNSINKYTKLDPTLPRTNTVPCPNEQCPAKGDHPDIIYIRYDNRAMKYAYLCTACDTVWEL